MRRDVVLLAIHFDVSVADQLAGLRARCGESERVHHVVEPELELTEQVLTSDTGLLVGALEVETKLALQKPVDTLHLLLFAKLNTVSKNFGAATSVLARRVVAALDRALVFETTIALEKELHTLTPAQPADGIRVTCH